MHPIIARLPQVDGEPRRALACMNLRREEKRVFDHLQSWWSLQMGQDLSQPDVVSIVLAAALRSGLVDVPGELAPGDLASR